MEDYSINLLNINYYLLFWRLGNRDLNLTSYLMYYLPKISLTDRRNYLIKFDVLPKCTSCSDGYKFNAEKEACTKNDCGNECSKCVLDSYTLNPICATCNESLLRKQIFALEYAIAQFYFIKEELPNFTSMVSFTKD